MPRPPTNESAASERLERDSLQSRVLKADYRIGSFSSTPRDVDGDPLNGRIFIAGGFGSNTEQKKHPFSGSFNRVFFVLRDGMEVRRRR